MTPPHPHQTTSRRTPASSATTGRAHATPDSTGTEPPTRSKVTAALAALACAACCALPFLITAGVLTGAGAAVAQKGLLAVSGVLLAAAGAMWWMHRRRAARGGAAKGDGACANGNCAC